MTIEDPPGAGDAGLAYAHGQLGRAFETAMQHEDPATRSRAGVRVARWLAVVRGIAGGTLDVGSRTPVSGMPAWVTPEVMRGGFATGAAAAEGPLFGDEQEHARVVGAVGSRSDLFADHLTEDGLARLLRKVESGAYLIEVPEHAALLVVAWLAGRGDVSGATRLVATIAPWSASLRFSPLVGSRGRTDRTLVHRSSVGEALRKLERRRPRRQLEAMIETLSVWNPLADQALELWLETSENGRVGSTAPDGWGSRADALLARYRLLADEHRSSARHRDPKANLAVLLRSLERARTAPPLSPRESGLLQVSVDGMVARRGRPGTDEHGRLRAAQARQAALPTFQTLAMVVYGRVVDHPDDAGLADPEAVLHPISGDEADRWLVPVGTPIPDAVRKVVLRTRVGTPEVLLAAGTIGSAEVLAELVPTIAASAVAEAYPDPALGALMASNYEAFRRRRTLLLLDLAHQVRIDELPWVAAVAPHRDGGDRPEALSALRRLARLTLTAFPATLVPSTMVSELDHLARQGGLHLPLLEELAADIFMGTFSAKFLDAAKLAGQLLTDSLYARYYDIDYALIASIDDVASGTSGPRTSAAFDALCVARAGGATGGWSVAGNGRIIEQAQILTTQNLAPLTGPLIADHPGCFDHEALAARCLDRVLELVGRIEANPRPLRTVKDAAYAWRHMVFFLSGLPEQQQRAFAREATARAAAAPPPVAGRMRPATEGLQRAVAGQGFDALGRNGDGRRLQGWADRDGHWMIHQPPGAAPR